MIKESLIRGMVPRARSRSERYGLPSRYVAETMMFVLQKTPTKECQC